MSSQPDLPWMREWTQLIAAEIRSRMAVKRISDVSIAEKMGVTQPYFNRRKLGITPFNAAELLMVCDIMDEDFASVVAAAKAQATHTTNLCLSQTDCLIAEEQISEWARRGYEYARLEYGMRATLDSYARSA